MSWLPLSLSVGASLIFFWSILGFWFACTVYPDHWLGGLRPHWLSRVVIYLMSGPLWWILDMVMRIVDRLTDD